MDNEVNNVTSGSYTAEFWQYDSRLGRRWNVDPKPVSSFSSYLTLSNNPIIYSDTRGDTSIYYDEQGNFLKRINDKLENAVVVISSKNVDKFNEHLKYSEGNKGLNSKSLAKRLRELGDSYMTDDLFGFYDDNDEPDYDLPGGQYAQEHGSILYNKDGEIRQGYENYVGEDEHVDYSKNIGGSGPRIPGATADGRVHTHPNEGLPNNQGIPLPGGWPSSSGGISGQGDWGTAPVNGFNVVVGKSQLSIYGYKKIGSDVKKVTITINRNLGTNR